ncbi:hypothetical protein [Ammoniphilus sp. YIM 78166]|uniref:hypothetical protein n=1 Tax=Ammoniphilus sp. YIM 78166 TaxID=1644106 RepID=UPI00106F10BB|nr:hypothetical protein [Ammoniphilus sp. YIM 78166]
MKKRFGLILSTLLVGQALMMGVAGADSVPTTVENGVDTSTQQLINDHILVLGVNPKVEVKVLSGDRENFPVSMKDSIIRAAKVIENTKDKTIPTLILFEDSTGRDLFVVDPPSAIP